MVNLLSLLNSSLCKGKHRLNPRRITPHANSIPRPQCASGGNQCPTNGRTYDALDPRDLRENPRKTFGRKLSLGKRRSIQRLARGTVPHYFWLDQTAKNARDSRPRSSNAVGCSHPSYIHRRLRTADNHRLGSRALENPPTPGPLVAHVSECLPAPRCANQRLIV